MCGGPRTSTINNEDVHLQIYCFILLSWPVLMKWKAVVSCCPDKTYLSNKKMYYQSYLCTVHTYKSSYFTLSSTVERPQKHNFLWPNFLQIFFFYHKLQNKLDNIKKKWRVEIWFWQLIFLRHSSAQWIQRV